MNRKLLFAVLAAAAASLLLGVARASAWHKDPDSMVDPVKVVASLVLPTPDVTIGDQDTTVAGIGDAAVGAGAMSYSDPPHGTTFWVDNTPLDGDCPQAGRTIRELAIRRTTGAVVIAVRKPDGRFEITPDPDERIEVGDVVIAIGTEPELRALEEVFSTRTVGV